MSDDPVDTPHLQVVAVRAEPPTGTPDQPVALTLLASSEMEGNDAGVEIAWLGGCHNPPGGEFFGCYPQLRREVLGYRSPIRDTPENELVDHPGVLGIGKTFSFVVPGDVVTSTRTTGMSFAFFGVCRGTLIPAPEITNSVPFACLDGQGQRQGRVAFEVGFVTVPTVLGAVNHNPVLQGLLVDRANVAPVAAAAPCQVDADCPPLGEGALGMRCVGADPTVSSGRCAPELARCRPESCESHVFLPIVDPASAEPNPLAANPGQPVPPEILTVELRGPWFLLTKDFTLQSDQWNTPLEFALRVPVAYPDALLPLWIVLRDGRGGVAWDRWEFATSATQ